MMEARGGDASRLARGDAVNRGKRGVELAADCQIIDNIAKPTRSCGRCPREIDANRGTKPQVQIERGPIVAQQQQQQHRQQHNALPHALLSFDQRLTSIIPLHAYTRIYVYIYIFLRSGERVIRAI